MKNNIKSNPKKKNLILQGGLVVCITSVVALVVSNTIAWFTTSTVNETEPMTLEVSASRSFDLSLDGENFGRDLRIKIYDKENEASVNTLLNDLAPVITQTASGSKIDLYDPTKDDYSASPISDGTSEWKKANPTEFVYNYDDNCYYVVNAADKIADYIEFDLWIRSETELDVYLGNESYVKPTYSSNDGIYDYALRQVEVIDRQYDEQLYYDGDTKKASIVTDYKGDKYIYTYLGSTSTFIARAVDDGNGNYTYYNLNGSPSSKAAQAKAIIDNDNNNRIEQGEHQDTKTASTYYDDKGSIVGIIETSGGTSKYYANTEDYVAGTQSSMKTFKISTLSPYTYTEDIEKFGDVVKQTRVDRFSKNLAAGAMRVSFSEVDTETGENENLKFLWNPQPTYQLTNTPSGAKIDMVNQNEDTKYYTVGSDGKYVLNSFQQNMPLQLHNGAILSETDNPATGEIPVCSLKKPNSTTSFCMRRIKVRAYLDGNDNEAQDPLLSSSSSGNGKVDIKLQFVSLYDNVDVDLLNQDNRTYTFAAHRSSEEKEDGSVDYSNPKHTYTWSLSNSESATVEHIGSSVKITPTMPGALIVYAKDETGRAGTYTIVTPELDVRYSIAGDNNKKYILTALLNGSVIDNADIIYEIVDGDVTISNNEVTFVSGYFATVKAISKNGDGIGIVYLTYNGSY